jgi:hypothetical protein
MASLGAELCLYPEDHRNDTMKDVRMQADLLSELKVNGY